MATPCPNWAAGSCAGIADSVYGRLSSAWTSWSCLLLACAYAWVWCGQSLPCVWYWGYRLLCQPAQHSWACCSCEWLCPLAFSWYQTYSCEWPYPSCIYLLAFLPPYSLRVPGRNRKMTRVSRRAAGAGCLNTMLQVRPRLRGLETMPCSDDSGEMGNPSTGGSWEI